LSHFRGSVSSLPYSQGPATCPCPKRDKSNLLPLSPHLIYLFCTTSHLSLVLPSGLQYSASPTKSQFAFSFLVYAQRATPPYRLIIFHTASLPIGLMSRSIPYVTFRYLLNFYFETLLAPRPTLKLEDHSLSAVRNCLCSMLAAKLHLWRMSALPEIRGLALPW